MAKKARNIGLDTLAVIETTPNILIRKLVAHSDSPTEPSLEAFLPGADAEAEGDAFRLELIAVLDEQNSESLLPLETRCRRIRRLAEGKGRFHWIPWLDSAFLTKKI